MTNDERENRDRVVALMSWVGGIGFLLSYAMFELIAEEGLRVAGAANGGSLGSPRFWAAMRWPMLLTTIPLVAGFLIFFRRPRSKSKSTDDSVSLDI
jgi:hypothetical protein